jgi:hypothetical protein
VFELCRYVFAEAQGGAGNGVAPGATASVTIGLAEILPGLLLIVLARIFATGEQLRDLEQHTV